MFGNFNKGGNSPDDELGRRLFQRIKDAMKPKESEEERKLRELTELSEWMNSAARPKVEQRLSDLRGELMKFYQRGEVGGNSKENELRQKIQMLDGYLQSHQI